jgi:hypothetical protein
MTPNLLANFINAQNFDVRISTNGRWIDQKCAYDAVNFVSDCILEYIRDGGSQPFHSPDIWKSEYAVRNVQLWFGKPNPLQPSTMDEFNKFFRQPMKMLAAAGVLNETKVGNSIDFSVANIDVLEYIALRERNSFIFLCLYIEKTIRDSGLGDSFDSFFDEESIETYDILKNKFADFCIANTPINTITEANRIFIKVLNPLACKLHKKGTIKGTVSGSIITFDNIQYNRPNWRDVKKNKNVARGDYDTSESSKQMYVYKVTRAKKNLRQFNDKYNNKKSEILDKFSVGEIATHMHHIFPRQQFKEIADYIENLIALTSGQHLQRAHPNGQTKVIDVDYQYLCLIAKTESIRRNLLEKNDESIIYDFADFMHVLNVGLKTDYFKHLQLNDFRSVVTGIEVNY